MKNRQNKLRVTLNAILVFFGIGVFTAALAQVQTTPEKESANPDRVPVVKTQPAVKEQTILIGNKSGADDEDDGKPSSPNDGYGQTAEEIGEALDTINSGSDEPIVINPTTPGPNGKGCYIEGGHYRYSSRVDAKWRPWHNTNNFKYVTRPGRDYYQHKRRANRRVETRCKNDGANRKKTYINDYYPNGADTCRETRSSCPSGYSSWKKHAESTGRAICVKKVADKPHTVISQPVGDFKRFDQKNKYRLIIVSGEKDYFRHVNKPSRRREAKCPGGYRYRYDFAGGTDKCISRAPCSGDAFYIS